MKKLITLMITFFMLVGIGCSGSYNEEEINNIYQISPNICVAMTMPGKIQAADNIRSRIITHIHQQDRNIPIDMCIYGLDDETIIGAIEQAINEGIHIRFIGNADGNKKLSSDGYYYEGYRRIASALDICFPSENGARTNCSKYSQFNDFALINTSGIMHNKFMIFTDNDGHKTVMTGSMNFTQSCIEINNNDIIFISDNNLAAKYVRYFEYLLKLNHTPEGFETLNVDGIKIEAGFSRPSSKSSYISDKILSVVRDCESSADFMIFTMTYEPLFNILNNKSETMVVRGLFDTAQLRSSKEELLLKSDAECRSDGNECIQNNHGGKLHHKCMILDAESNSAAVITGSFNWTLNADKQNNENILIIHSQTIAQYYSKYFEGLWKQGKIMN
ncbi:MAG: hypothetical protein J6W76_04900 [Spirochaetales bacterium]|nr:hypothetical protein [Spirochaetales bacterium]